MRFFWQNADKENVQNTDYAKLSEDELLDCFKSRTWENLAEEKRIAVIQEMENRNAVRQEREPAVVASLNDRGSYGSYNNSYNQINIDVMNVSSHEALDTYVHESRHAYQVHCIQNGRGYDEHMLGMMQVENARDGEGNLYNYALEYPEYDMQCNELDSNSSAAVFMVSQKERYQDDLEYHEYIKERTDHFAEVNSFLRQDGGRRSAMQNSQVCLAFANGDVSEEKCHLLTQNINDGQYVDAAVTENYAAEEKVLEVYNELLQDHSKDGIDRNGSGRENDHSFGMA